MGRFEGRDGDRGEGEVGSYNNIMRRWRGRGRSEIKSSKFSKDSVSSGDTCASFIHAMLFCF